MNQKKKNSPELQLIAAAKLKENELMLQSLSVGERKKLSHTRTEEDEFTEVEVNRIINEITQKFLADHLLTVGDKPPIDEYIPYTESLNCITFLVKSATGGRGSQQAVRRSIDAYCCSLGRYQVIRDEGIRIIRRRKGN